MISNQDMEEQELQAPLLVRLGPPAPPARWPCGRCAGRGQQDLSQQAFAELPGLRSAQVALLEQGDQHPSAELLAGLAAAAGVEFPVAVHAREQAGREVGHE